MSHMNYFEPYESKSKGHEDQLTRAYLVLLRYSSTSFMSFCQMVHEACLELAEWKSKDVNLTSISKLPLSDVGFYTQTSTISNVPVISVLSVLLTDESFVPKSPVSPSDRGARYDGVITIGDEIVLVIENKPSQKKVWEGQLSPSKKDLPEDANLISLPAIVEWKDIIIALNHIRGLDSIGGAERLMIDDFLSYVNKHYPSLNPFNRLSLCGNDNNLIKKRLEKLLSSIAVKSESVRLHRNWGWCIDIFKPEIKSVGLIADKITDNSENPINITISMYFGDIQSQSFAFYNRDLEYDSIKEQLDSDWKVVPNFHIAFAQRVLLRLDCPENRYKEYYDFWSNNKSLITQHNQDEVVKLINKLDNEGIVVINEDKRSEIIAKIENPNFQKFNICPSMGILYEISIVNARELDNDKNELACELYKRIKEGLNIVTSNVAQILKEPDTQQPI